MRRIVSVLAVGVAAACGSDGGGLPAQGDLVVSLGTLPGAIAANADSAFVRVRNPTLGVNDVRRIGLPVADQIMYTLPAGPGYDVTAVTLVSGTTKIGIGGDRRTGVTISDGTLTVTLSVAPFSIALIQLPDTLTPNQAGMLRAAVEANARAVTDGVPVGLNLFLTTPPTSDVYFPGSATDRFFSPSTGDTLVFNFTVPSTMTDVDLWFQVKWSASTTAANWTTGFPFDLALPTLALGDTLWRRPVDGAP